MPRCEPSTSKSYEEMSTGYQKTSKSYQKRQSRTPDYRNAIDSRRSLPESPPPSEKRKFRPGLLFICYCLFIIVRLKLDYLFFPHPFFC